MLYFNRYVCVCIYISEKIKYILKYGPKNFGTRQPLLPFRHAVGLKRNRTNLRGQWLLYVCVRACVRACVRVCARVPSALQ